jgi:hypothetical protein
MAELPGGTVTLLWSLHDRGEVRARQSGEAVRAYELVARSVSND